MRRVTITVAGYTRLAEIENVITASSQAFVAMWFNNSLDFLFPEAIEPAVKDAGYDALIINEEHFLDKIDDQIIAGFTCRKDMESKGHDLSSRISRMGMAEPGGAYTTKRVLRRVWVKTLYSPVGKI